MKKKFTFLMAALMLLTMMVLPGKAVADDYRLVTNISQLSQGDVILIVNSKTNGSAYALGTTQNTNNRKAESVSINDNIISTLGNAQEITLESKNAAGNFTLKVGATSYLYAANTSSSNKKNYLKSKNDNSVYWEITINTTSHVAAVSDVTSTCYGRDDMKYNANNNNPIFSCYDGGDENLFIFKKQTSYTITAQSNNPAYGTVSVSGSTITATPTSGYRVKAGTAGYTVISGTPSPSVTNNGDNTFTVTTTADCTIQINFEAIPAYTVTLGDDGSTLTEATAGAGVNLPSRSNIGDYTFVGWSTTNVAPETTAVPAIIPAGSYTPAADIALYPVYTREVSSISNVVDELDRAWTGRPESTSYGDWSGKNGTNSPAVYAGNSAGDHDAIQLRSSNSNSGIVTTTSGGTVKKVVISWNSNTAATRTVSIYGKNSKYDDATDLYSNDKKGTPLGELNIDNATNNKSELTVDDAEDYEYIGIRSKSGALYLDEVKITWTTSVTTTYYTSGYSMSISKWTDEDTSDGWYLIASPVGTVNPTNVGNLLKHSGDEYDVDGFDLYRFNQSVNDEWENWKQSTGDHYHFNLEQGKGYLYANSGNGEDDVTLTFLGTEPASPVNVTLAYSTDNSDAKMHGWNLIGNPFGTTATLKIKGSETKKPFYRMNTDHTGLIAEAKTDDVNAMEGIFVYTTTDGEEVTFAKTAKRATESNDDLIVIDLIANASTGSATVIDRAIVRFDEGETLPKFQLRDSNTKLYIPQNGKDYAIAFANRNGELPLNFKAEKIGEYTLGFSGENMNGINLVDKIENVVIDLSVNDSYSFIGSTTDRVDRFALVFSSTSSESDIDVFAYQSGNDIIVNGEGALEVYDVTGRKVMATTINGVQTVTGLNNGFYIFRLNEKTQKIVVR